MRQSHSQIRAILLFFAPALLLSVLRLHSMGAWEGGRWGTPGSDYYFYSVASRLIHDSKNLSRGQPILAFNYPEGTPSTQIPEFFSEPLWLFLINGLSKWVSDSTQVPYWGMVLTALLNIWLVWGLLFWRFGRTRFLPAFAGASVLCLSPWIFDRNFIHWQLGWAFIPLAVTLLWWDLLIHKIQRSPLLFGFLHFLLAAQSIYYLIFWFLLLGLWMIWVLGFQKKDSFYRVPVFISLFAAAMGSLIEVFWVVYNYGGLSAIHQTSVAAKRSLIELQIFSVRLREFMKGGDHSLWNQWVLPRIGSRTGMPSRDGEGFATPLPKVAMVFLFFSAFLLGKRRGVWKREERNKIIQLAWIGIIGFLMMGLQEFPWLRNNFLYPVLTFIRSYSRIAMPILCLLALFVCEVFQKSFVSLRKHEVAAFSCVWILLLVVDYGWPQEAYALQKGVACGTIIEPLQKVKGPIFIHSAVNPQKYFCPGSREFVTYGATGNPIISEIWNPPIGALLSGSATCEYWRSKLIRAQSAYGAGKVIWWFEGTHADFELSKKCLKPKNLKSLSGFPSVGKTHEMQLVDLEM